MKVRRMTDLDHTLWRQNDRPPNNTSSCPSDAFMKQQSSENHEGSTTFLKAIFFLHTLQKQLIASTAKLVSVLQLLLSVKSSWVAEISSLNIPQIHSKKFQSEKKSAGLNSGAPMGNSSGQGSAVTKTGSCCKLVSNSSCGVNVATV